MLQQFLPQVPKASELKAIYFPLFCMPILCSFLYFKYSFLHNKLQQQHW